MDTERDEPPLLTLMLRDDSIVPCAKLSSPMAPSSAARTVPSSGRSRFAAVRHVAMFVQQKREMRCFPPMLRTIWAS